MLVIFLLLLVRYANLNDGFTNLVLASRRCMQAREESERYCEVEGDEERLTMRTR